MGWEAKGKSCQDRLGRRNARRDGDARMGTRRGARRGARSRRVMWLTSIVAGDRGGGREENGRYILSFFGGGRWVVKRGWRWGGGRFVSDGCEGCVRWARSIEFEFEERKQERGGKKDRIRVCSVISMDQKYSSTPHNASRGVTGPLFVHSTLRHI